MSESSYLSHQISSEIIVKGILTYLFTYFQDSFKIITLIYPLNGGESLPAVSLLYAVIRTQKYKIKDCTVGH